ncbi:MAG TPA: hypothetical protein VMV75_05230 [Sulfuricella sp.]|nr:hypothetical protein [Sulfuricella sp.]
MNIKYFAFVLLAASAAVHADGGRIGLELESEKNNQTGITNHAVTLIPGWEFSEENFISRVELLVEKNRDMSADSDGVRAKENKLFLRIRHDGEFTDRIGYYVRGGVGRSSNNERNFNYAYVEPGVEYKFDKYWAWTVAYREINSIDGTPGKHVHKFYLGPSFDMDKNNEFEFRYVKGNGDQDVKAWLAEYVHKF